MTTQTPLLRSRVSRAVRTHPKNPAAAAHAIADELRDATQGQVRVRHSWIESQLTPVVEGAYDRAMGTDQAALAICRDLALYSPYDLTGRGWFDDDASVMDWHNTQKAQWERQAA